MSYSNVKRELVEQRPPEYRCRYCGQTAEYETLSSYGRCGPCYGAYCREPQRKVTDVAESGKGPHEWAYRLKRRHESGDRLTPAQVQAYRSVTDAPMSQPVGDWV